MDDPGTMEDLIKDTGDNGDRINTHHSLKTYCPDLACIWENMQKGKGLSTNFVCDLFKNFEDPNDWKNVLDIRAGSIKEKPAAYGKTEIKQGIIYITINKNNCGGTDKLDMYETIQHELIHAKIINECMNLYGFDGTTVNSLSFSQAFEKLVIHEYGKNATKDEHKLILDKYLHDMVNDLINITGKGTYDDYIGLVLNGFPKDILLQCGYAVGGGPGTVEDKYHTYQVFKHNNPDIFNNLNKVCP